MVKNQLKLLLVKFNKWPCINVVLQSAINGLFTVKYLIKSPFGEKYTFPENDDADEVEINQIIQILDEPIFDTRGHYTFNFWYSIQIY